MPIDEQQLNQLDLEDEAASKQVSLEEKRALIREAKRKYGKDYMQFLGNFTSKFTGKGSGMDWQALRFKLG